MFTNSINSFGKNIETGQCRFYFETILEICKKHNIKIIFEKDN